MPLVLIGPAYFGCNVHLLESVFRGFVYESDGIISFVCDEAF
jgi:hypothetical protein